MTATGPTRADMRASRPRRRRSRANVWLAIVAVLLVFVAAGIGVVAFLTWQDTQDTLDANQPLAARVASLRADLDAANTAIDDLSALFIAIKAQNDATAAATAAVNAAAERYNNAEAGITDALGADAVNALAALSQATTAAKTAADQVQGAIDALRAGASR